jgi:Intracellular proteinase inhibitor
MLGTKTFTASLLIGAAALSFAAQPDYFPLQSGNSWAYKGTSRLVTPTTQTIDVEGTERFRDQEYFRVGFLGRTLFLRGTDTGVSVFNTASGTESTWLAFDGGERSSLPVDIEPCTRAAKIESRAAKIKVPAGEWENALHLTFEQSCADAGLTQMYLVPGLGIVMYETSSFAGPVRYELTYSRAGSIAVEAPQTAFTVSLDSPTYKAAETIDLLVRLTLRSTQPVTLTFPSSQRYDLRIWNDKGEIAYAWSADKLFAQVLTREQLGPGERTFAFVANVSNLPVGRYVAEAWLATQSREFVGHVGFEVVR